MTTQSTAGQRIRQRREELGYNQEELARLVGCSQSTLSELETGESKLPSARVLAKMCEVFGKKDRWIIYGEEGDVTVPSQDEVALLQAFRGLTDEARQSLMGIVKALPQK